MAQDEGRVWVCRGGQGMGVKDEGQGLWLRRAVGAQNVKTEVVQAMAL